MIARAFDLRALGKVPVSADCAGAEFYPIEQLRSGEAPYGIPCGLDVRSGRVALLKTVHAVCCGSTGSGKSVSLAAPTICAAAATQETPTLLVFDVKGDLFEQTAAFVASRGYVVHHLSLYGGSTDLFNPLYHPWELWWQGKQAEAEDFLRAIYEALFEPLTSSKDPFWARKATENMILASMLLIDTTKRNASAPTIRQVLDLVSGDPDGISAKASMCSASLSRRVAGILRSSDSCLSDQIAHIQTRCSFFAGGLGEHITRDSTFDYEEIFATDAPRAFFFSLPESASAAVKSFFSVIMDTFMGHYVAQKSRHADSRPMVAVLDEFSSYPKSKMGGVVDLLATARSRGLFINLFLQSSEQLLSGSKYDQHEALAALAQCRTMFLFNSSTKMELELLMDRGGLDRASATCLNYLRAGECEIVNNLDNYHAQRVQLPPLSAYQQAGLFVTDEPLPDVGAYSTDDLGALDDEPATEQAAETPCSDTEQAAETPCSDREPPRFPYLDKDSQDWLMCQIEDMESGSEKAMFAIMEVCSGTKPPFDMRLHAEYAAIGEVLCDLYADEDSRVDRLTCRRAISLLVNTVFAGLSKRVIQMKTYTGALDKDFARMCNALNLIHFSIGYFAPELKNRFTETFTYNYLGSWAMRFVVSYFGQPHLEKEDDLMSSLAKSFAWFEDGAICELWALMSGGARVEDLPDDLKRFL